MQWGNLDPVPAFRPRNQGDPAATDPGVALIGGTGGNATVASTGYGNALRALDEIDDAALIVCGSDGMLNASDETVHNGLVNAVLGYVEARPQHDLFLVAEELAAFRPNVALEP